MKIKSSCYGKSAQSTGRRARREDTEQHSGHRNQIKVKVLPSPLPPPGCFPCDPCHLQQCSQISFVPVSSAEVAALLLWKDCAANIPEHINQQRRGCSNITQPHSTDLFPRLYKRKILPSPHPNPKPGIFLNGMYLLWGCFKVHYRPFSAQSLNWWAHEMKVLESI